MDNQLNLDLLNEFLQKTIEKRIPWNLINPNAVRWTKQSPPQVTIVTLQKQTVNISGTLKENFVLTIQTQTGTLLQINTGNDLYAKDILNNLFNEAKLSANDKTAQVLRDLLKGL